MRSVSIKTRIVFWYALTALLVLSVVIVLILAAGNRSMRDEAMDDLTLATDQAVENIRIYQGKLYIDEYAEYQRNGVYVVLCDNTGNLFFGEAPEGFPMDTEFQEETIRYIDAAESDEPFFVYDRRIENQKAGVFWIRGITSAGLEDTEPALYEMIRIFLITIPVLFVISLVGGWIITRRAFLPFQNIAEKVERIQEGSDLSQRLNLGSPDDRDEIRRTAGLFDHMLARIEKSFEMEKQFTNDVSHELRTPTAVIMSQCEYALDNIDDPDEVEDSLKVIHHQSKQMMDLITQLLTLARADRHIQPVNKELVDVGLLLEEEAAHMSVVARERNIRITVDALEGIMTEADPVLMRRALENLISNAVKYGREGGMIRLYAEREPARMIAISVEDDGIGIPEEDLPYIWNRFFRAENAGDFPDSVGLGLSLVKWIAEAHGGTVSAQNRPEGGARFILRIP